MENPTQPELISTPESKVRAKRNQRTKLYAFVSKRAPSSDEVSLDAITADNYAELRKQLEAPEVAQVFHVMRGKEIPFTEKRTLKFF